MKGIFKVIAAALAGLGTFFVAKRANATASDELNAQPDPNFPRIIPDVPAGVPDFLRPAGSTGGRNPISGSSVLTSPTFGGSSDPLALRLPSDRWQVPATADPYLPLIRRVEATHRMPRNMLASLLYQESRFRADAYNSKVGASGIAQIVPRWHPGVDPLNPNEAIPYAGAFLADLFKRFGTWEKALAAYNWGPGNVASLGLSKAPKETRDYYPTILSRVG